MITLMIMSASLAAWLLLKIQGKPCVLRYAFEATVVEEAPACTPNSPINFSCSALDSKHCRKAESHSQSHSVTKGVPTSSPDYSAILSLAQRMPAGLKSMSVDFSTTGNSRDGYSTRIIYTRGARESPRYVLSEGRQAFACLLPILYSIFTHPRSPPSSRAHLHTHRT